VENKRKATEEMERPDPGNLKLSWVRLKSISLMMMMMMMLMMVMTTTTTTTTNYARLAGGVHAILSARHTSTVFIIM
jgi:hypothetical protein